MSYKPRRWSDASRCIAATLVVALATGTTMPAWAYVSPVPVPDDNVPGTDLVPPPSCLTGHSIEGSEAIMSQAIPVADDLMDHIGLWGVERH